MSGFGKPAASADDVATWTKHLEALRVVLSAQDAIERSRLHRMKQEKDKEARLLERDNNMLKTAVAGPELYFGHVGTHTKLDEREKVNGVDNAQQDHDDHQIRSAQSGNQAELMEQRQKLRQEEKEQHRLSKEAAHDEQSRLKQLVFSGGCLNSFKFSVPVNCVATTTTGNLVVGTDSNMIQSIRPDCGKILTSIKEAHSDAVYSVTCCDSEQGQVIVSGGDKEVKVWLADRCKAILEGHTSFVWALCTITGPRGETMVASGSADKTIRIWKLMVGSRYEVGRCIAILDGHRDSVYCLTSFPDKKTIASGSADTKILLWNTHTSTIHHVLIGHTSLVNSMCVAGDDQLASACMDTDVRIWCTKSGNCLHVFGLHEHPVTCIAQLPGNCFISGDKQGLIMIWSTERRLRSLAGHTDQINGLTILTKDGGDGVAASAAEDGTVRVWGLLREFEFL